MSKDNRDRLGKHGSEHRIVYALVSYNSIIFTPKPQLFWAMNGGLPARIMLTDDGLT